MFPFWFKAPGLNDMCIFKVMNLIKMFDYLSNWTFGQVKQKIDYLGQIGH